MRIEDMAVQRGSSSEVIIAIRPNPVIVHPAEFIQPLKSLEPVQLKCENPHQYAPK
jgi:hypothetical protein